VSTPPRGAQIRGSILKRIRMDTKQMYSLLHMQASILDNSYPGVSFAVRIEVRACVLRSS
jgi:hypothetical protein